MKKLFLHEYNHKIVCILLFLLTIPSTAQTETTNRTSLATILKSLQSQHDCNFTYVDELIENIAITPPPKALTLDESIAYLQQTTKLAFIQIDQKNIAIQPNSDPVLYTFCATLIDQKTLLPIPNATISYHNKTDYSNTDGTIRITEKQLPKNITISSLGYQKKQLKNSIANENNCATIALIPEVVRLNPTVISNYLTKGISQQSDGSLEIDYKDFGILPGLIEPDVLQTLQALPGIQSVNESVTDLNIRGGTNDQNLILWDGIKMYQSGHFFGLISAFNPYLTEKATVTKNGTSARYGDGVSGTITIKTSDSIPEKLNAGVGTNMINADAFINAPLGKKVGLQFAARKSFSEIISTPTYTNYFDKAFQNTEVLENNNTNLNSDSQFSFYDINTRLLYKASSKDYFKTNFLWIENDLVFKENGVFEGTPLSRESGAAQRSISGSLQYNRIWNKDLSTQLQFYGTTYRLQAENADIASQQRLLQRNEVLETGLKISNTHSLSNKIMLLSGYQFTETGITNLQDVTNPLVRSEVKEVLRMHSAFLESTYSDTKKTNSTVLSFGVRANYIEKFDRFLVEPRVSLNQQFWNHFAVLLAAELKNQTTSQIITIQNDFLGIENRRWELANTDDRPIIQSQQASIGLQYKNNGWLWSAEGYLKKVNGITTQSQGFQNGIQSTPDTGSYQVQGGDFLIYKSFPSFNIWGSYTFAKNVYNFDTLLPSEFPNNIDIRHTVSLGAAYTLNNFKIGAGLNWHSGIPITNPISGNPISNTNTIIFENPPNQSNLPDFLRLDTSATYNFQLKDNIRVHAGISLWNFTNNDNIFNSFYRIVDENAVIFNQNALRFTPNATLRIFFD